eukprot:767594-Hanusia_phi.AAC.10
METSKPSTQGSLLCLYTRNLDPLTAVAYEMSILPRTQIGLLGAVFASSMSVGLELGSLCSNGSSISYRNMFDGEILAVLILRNDNHGSSEVASDEQDFLFQLIEKAITLVVGADNVYSMCNNVNQFRRSIRTSTVLLQQILQHRHNLIFMTRSIPVNTALLSATRDEMDTRMDSLCNLLGSSHVCFLDKDAMIFATPMWMALDEKTRVLLHLFFMAMDPAKDELNIFIEVNVACKLSVLRCEGSSKVVCYLSRGDSQRDTERLESCTADLVKFLEEEGETLRFKLNGCGIMTVNSSSNLLKLLFVRRDVGLCWIFLPEKAGSLSSQSAGEGWEQQFAVLVHEARTQYLEIHEAKLKQEVKGRKFEIAVNTHEMIAGPFTVHPSGWILAAC